MPRITALLQTRNDGLRLGRCLETLYPCDDIVVVDHGSEDDTVRIARDYGARIVIPESGGNNPHHSQARLTADTWILCLDPRESLSESLAASLFEWKSDRTWEGGQPRAIFVREETAQGWNALATAQTRLVPSQWDRWQGHLPRHDPGTATLEGDLLRFVFP